MHSLALDEKGVCNTTELRTCWRHTAKTMGVLFHNGLTREWWSKNNKWQKVKTRGRHLGINMSSQSPSGRCSRLPTILRLSSSASLYDLLHMRTFYFNFSVPDLTFRGFAVFLPTYRQLPAIFPITSLRLPSLLCLSMSALIYVMIDQGIYWEKTNSP